MRLTDEQLAKRANWEECAPNAYQQPDESVLAMIAEIQTVRRGLKQFKDCHYLAGTPQHRLLVHYLGEYAP